MAPPLLSETPGRVGVDFYVTGGTLRHDAPSYVERKADKQLCEGLLAGEFCYVLTSRQMGKSSLMVRTVKRLRAEKVAVAVLDLTAIGQNLTVEQWYEGLLSRLGQQLNLEDELFDFCEAHPEWGPLQRWITAIEQVVLQKITTRMVIFVDEIDIVRSLKFSTDEFFAAIREFFNRRSRDNTLNRLAFGLLGVATPTDLICDPRMTPFNVGRRIELNDFTPAEAEPLSRGLCVDESQASVLLQRVLFWTGGHPYLTQRLCRALAEGLCPSPAQTEPPLIPTEETVDLLAQKLFLTRQARDRDDNLIFVRERILRSDVDVAGLLYLYRKVRNGQRIADDETNPLISVLHLSGIVRGSEGCLQVRNRIYWRVFDSAWIHTNMPEAELRRQRRAGRRGMLLGFGAAVMLLLGYLVFGPLYAHYRQSRIAARTLAQVVANYSQFRSYRDTFESSLDIGVGGTTVPITDSGSLLFERPDKLDLLLRTSLTSPELELRIKRDEEGSWISAPGLKQYQTIAHPGQFPFALPPETAAKVGPARILPVYQLFLTGPFAQRLPQDAKEAKFVGTGTVNGQPVNIIRWEQEAGPLLKSLGVSLESTNHALIPINAWVNRSNYLVVKIQLELSKFADELVGPSVALPVTGLTITETHKGIATDRAPADPARFSFQPEEGERQVAELSLPPANFAKLTSPKRQFERLIPRRLPQTPPECIDLTDFYNAALLESWHPGMANNTLDMLPPGLLQLADTVFDVRGIIQLSSLEMRRGGGKYPEQINGLRIERKCRQLQFLHAAGWQSPNGTQIGAYVIHYSDGSEKTFPIVYGAQVRDWNSSQDNSQELTDAIIVWSGINNAGLHVRLFKTTWPNPMPEREITTIDYVSNMASSAPFLVALTAED